MAFSHLHVHTEYSLLDGFSKIKKLVKRVQEMGMSSVAITDHGTMFGVVEFYKEAKAAGIKPIIGLEAYMAPRRLTDKDSRLDKQSSHLLLLAENMTGYQNLLKIASVSQLEGFYYHPRIDHEFLAAHSEGLIATSGCMAAEIPRALMAGDLQSARSRLDWYYDVFGADRFFLELQQHDIKELPAINKALREMGTRYEAKFIATNDVHYVDAQDYKYQDILLAIQTGALLSDNSRFRMTDKSYYLRSPEEMSALFSEIPEALSNTQLIADRCEVDLGMKGYHLPLFDVPEGHSAQTYLRELCEEGLRRRYGARANATDVRERLDYELGVIHQMGFDAYFLIVWDLCRHARETGIWYNARGSAAGSLVAYTLDITLVEPIYHGLIFERFLNPGRISMPDIDLDFQDDKRSKVMEYCAQKYGDDKVAQIITFGTMGARGAIRDVGRVMDVPLSEVDRISKMIPNTPSQMVKLTEAIEALPELKTAVEQAGYLRDLVETAAHLEGVVRNAGTHAAGVIITDKPIIEYAPLHRPTSGSEDSPIKSVAQFEMSVVDAMGLLKVDFLGLSTLTVMARACELIEQRHGVKLNLANIPIDDDETFDFLGKGHTAGVFQLEGTGMTRYLVQMKPHNLANIIAMVALYRPGPLEFIPSYIKRMHGEEEVTYRHPMMEPIFKETYGIPIYQEQIMFAAMELAQYTASEADDLRKAISKKKADAIAKHREKFVEGSCANGIDRQIACDIFTDWENFARYGFNKSHAADYGVIAVETAYLKTHYTVEYMTALLSASKNETDKVALYVADCRNMGIDVLPPDVNHSGWDFAIEDRAEGGAAIRFGMGAIKNVGQGPVEGIMLARENGPFKDLTDFAQRVDLRAVGKRALESLIRVGALDAFGGRRALMDGLDSIVGVSSAHFRAAESGQLSFFGMEGGVEEVIELPPSPPLDRRAMLEWERELLGLYVSDHPLSPYLPVFQKRVTHFSAQLNEAQNKEKVVVAGMVSRFRTHTTKTGKMMAFVTLEDLQGNIELVVFPRVWDQFGSLVSMDAVLAADGKMDNENGDPKVLVDRLHVLTMDDLPEDAAVFGVDLIPEEGYTLERGYTLDRGYTLNGGYTFDEEDDLPNEEPMSVREAVPQMTAPAARPVEAAPPPARTTQPVAPVVAGAADWDVEDMPPPPEPPDWFPPGSMLADAPLGAVKAAPKAPEPPPVEPIRSTASAQPAVQPLENEAPRQKIKEPPSAPVYMPVPYLVAPGANFGLANDADSDALPARMLTIILRATGSKERDVRRLRHIHGMLRSCPGKDHFAFMLFEAGHYYLIEFPNNTTGISLELVRKLAGYIGEENVRVEPIKIQ